jgi:hypothetical protein
LCTLKPTSWAEGCQWKAGDVQHAANAFGRVRKFPTKGIARQRLASESAGGAGSKQSGKAIPITAPISVRRNGHGVAATPSIGGRTAGAVAPTAKATD